MINGFIFGFSAFIGVFVAYMVLSYAIDYLQDFIWWLEKLENRKKK